MTDSSNKFYSLFFSVFFLFAGFGLFLNSAGVKLAQMGVSNTAIGALNAAFFVGAALSAVAAHRVVSGVGHIRAFSVFGAVFAIAALGHMMTDNLWAWGVLRVVLGFCYYSLLMIVESWFAERSMAAARARVLAEDDAACVADLVIVELTEVLHIHLDLVDVGHGNEAAQLNIQMLGHALDSAGHVGQLADAGGLDNDAVGVVLLHHLLQSGAEIAHQRAADAAGVQLIDLDAGLLQKAAVDADLAELVLDEHDLLACKGLFDELLDKGGLTGAKEAGENIDLGHSLKCLFLLCRRRKGAAQQARRALQAVRAAEC